MSDDAAYQDFLARKALVVPPTGMTTDYELSGALFDWQRDIVRWALRKGRAGIFADCGLGKGQPEGALILTPNGFVPNTSLEPGDKIIASDGLPYTLLQKHIRGVQPVYRVHFSDGCSMVVDEDHLHIVRTNNDRQRGRPWRVMSTADLLTKPLRYGEKGKSRNYDIPVVAPVQFASRQHWIHPYVLGVLLGDGCITRGCTVTIADDAIIDEVRRLLPEGWTVARINASKYDYKISRGGTNARDLVKELRRLGILGTKSGTKFIPPEYLLDSVENRVWLLRGLMDTDGYSGESSQFYSTSERLANDAEFLVRSLGGIPTRAIKHPSCMHNGTRRDGAPCHVITFSLRTFNPFFLPRKAARWNPTPRDNGRWLDRIEACGQARTICLSVDSPDHSYVTENFIVTHNTVMQLEWARVVFEHAGPVLILCPLAVAAQTVAEAKRFGITDNIRYQREQSKVCAGITVTNYEMLDRFDPAAFDGIVLDESSILKAYDGKTRNQILSAFSKTPFRLACTATPAPNDFMELGNHSEFMGALTRPEMLATFFTHDGGDTSQWRLKGHAQVEFWRWVASWAVMLRKPSDLGYSDEGFNLPPLNVIEHKIKTGKCAEGYLFPMPAVGLNDQRAAKRSTLEDRVRLVAELVNSTPGSWLVWCELNDEGNALTKAIEGAVQVAGSDKQEDKIARMQTFTSGEARVLVSKSSICGHGMNWQHCHQVAFVGMTHSYEMFYQSVRRSWRFGQTVPVDCHIVVTDLEDTIWHNVQRKQADADRMAAAMVQAMAAESKEVIRGSRRTNDIYRPTKAMRIPSWLRSEAA